MHLDGPFNPSDLVSDNRLAQMVSSYTDIAGLGSGNIQMIIRHYRRAERLIIRSIEEDTTDELSESLLRIRAKIRDLRKIQRTAEPLPIFPRLRQPDHFKRGNKVLCYVTGLPYRNIVSFSITESRWKSAIIVNGPSLVGTRFAVFFDEVTFIRQDTDRSLTHEIELFVVDPRVLFPWEVDALKANPEYAKQWFRQTESYAPLPRDLPLFLMRAPHAVPA